MHSATSDVSSHFLHSSVSSEVMEQPINDRFKIVADAVVVNDPEVYDAKLMHDGEAPSNNKTRAPHIFINNVYSLPEDKPSRKRHFPALILIAIIVGCSFIATRIV